MILLYGSKSLAFYLPVISRWIFLEPFRLYSLSLSDYLFFQTKLNKRNQNARWEKVIENANGIRNGISNGNGNGQ